MVFFFFFGCSSHFLVCLLFRPWRLQCIFGYFRKAVFWSWYCVRELCVPNRPHPETSTLTLSLTQWCRAELAPGKWVTFFFFFVCLNKSDKLPMLFAFLKLHHAMLTLLQSEGIGSWTEWMPADSFTRVSGSSLRSGGSLSLASWFTSILELLLFTLPSVWMKRGVAGMNFTLCYSRHKTWPSL